MRVSNLLRALAIACAAVTVALVGAQSADAALSWTGGHDRAGGQDRSAAHCGGPCYVVNVEVHGIGHVSTVIPAAVPGATSPSTSTRTGTSSARRPAVWNCSFYFNWPFDQEGLNPNNEVVVFQATGGTFLGWSSCPDGHAQRQPVPARRREGSAGLVDCVVAEFQENPDDGGRQLRRRGRRRRRSRSASTWSRPGQERHGDELPESRINCGSVCQKYFANGELTLNATPASGSTFAGWVIREYGYDRRRSRCCRRRPPSAPPRPCARAPGRCTGINEYRATAKFNLAKPPVPNTVLLSKPQKIDEVASPRPSTGARSSRRTP